jgi:bifunctional DNA-binding transcriptional regulator/antitoxin component of YhaV-PrlF toxin-antitoxin module
MPQLAKGGKWVFGWVAVEDDSRITIPAEAYQEYGFQAGDEVVFLRGSRRSGGLAVGRVERVAAAAGGLELQKRAVGRGEIEADRRVLLPTRIGISPGDRLLAVRGSGLALSFIARGPIYEEALKHTDLLPWP